MISDEVRMLINRMRSYPEEFAVDQLNFGADREVRRMRRWDNFMNSLVNRKPDIELIFNQEEIEALRQTASEILRPIALGTIVKQIVGGEEEEPQQMEMEYTHTPTASRAEKLQEARVQLIKQYLETQSQ